MPRFSLTATALATSLAALAGTAHAGCDATVTCTGTETSPVADSRDGLTVTVLPGAEVIVATGDAITLSGDTNTVDNAGLIESTDSGDEAILYSGDDLTVLNRAGAIVRAGDRGLERDGGSGLTLINDGTILAVDDAIRDDEGDVNLANGAGAVIESIEEKAIRVRGTTADIANAGTIRAASEAVEGRDGFSMTNSGLVESTGDDAIQFGDGTLVNEAGGIIRGGDDGVDVDSGRIINRGLITTTAGDAEAAAIDVDEVAESGAPAPKLRIDNEGTISAVLGILFDTASTAEQEIFNSGLIEGTGGTAVQFAGGQGQILMALDGGSRIVGDVLFGGKDDLLAIGDITSGGLGSGVFDGGNGADKAAFGASYGLGDLLRVIYEDAVTVRLEIAAGNGDRLSGTFRNFETFGLGGTSYGFDQLGDLAPVPLPAGLPLLAAGLAGLIALRRRS